jgi:hypothetical protein
MTSDQESTDKNADQVSGFSLAQEVKIATEATEIEPSAERASERIEAWYRELGPRLGAYLANPNVVLTLADARGFTEFATNDLEDSDEEAFARLNVLTQPQGIYFEPHIVSDADTPYVHVEVISLPGLEYATNQTMLPGVPRFHASEGRQGFAQWNSSTQAAVGAARMQGSYPSETDSISSKSIVVASGIARGYPDEAIMSALTESASAGLSVKTHVPYSDYYECEQPNYSYDSKDEAVISRHVAAWGHILERYYRSSVHQSLEEDEEFRRAREAADA